MTDRSVPFLEAPEIERLMRGLDELAECTDLTLVAGPDRSDFAPPGPPLAPVSSVFLTRARARVCARECVRACVRACLVWFGLSGPGRFGGARSRDQRPVQGPGATKWVDRSPPRNEHLCTGSAEETFDHTLVH